MVRDFDVLYYELLKHKMGILWERRFIPVGIAFHENEYFKITIQDFRMNAICMFGEKR